MSGLIESISQTVEATVAPLKEMATGEMEPPSNPARAFQQVGGAILGATSLAMDVTNAGVAAVTSSLAAALPPFPAATLGSLYVGIPHAHLHPPSWVPPAPPIPLPSIGAVLLGTCVQVLIGGMPAARAGDLGLAPTCGGFAPFFEIFLGSSKVFIGGARAARMTDVCVACTKTATGAMRGIARAMSMAGKAMALAGVVADGLDAISAEGDAAMAEANAIAAGMGAAQMAADAIATAASAAMGTDPGIPPAVPGPLLMGVPKVLIAGLPLPTLPDPAQWLFNKLKRRPKSKKGGQDEDKSKVGCTTCKK
jgi:uncharacterized Zn-binding protein involved in type VI secretion